MQEIKSEITIDAPATRVWSILLDFEHYSEWNPFMPRISGRAQRGERLEVRVTPPAGMAMTFRPVVTAVEPQRRFSWLGNLAVKGLFDGEHIFELQEAANGTTHFVQREQFTGLLVAPVLLLMRAGTQRGFQAMNKALKQRAESPA